MNAAQAIAFHVARDLRLFLDDDSNFGNSSPHEKNRSAADHLARVTKTDVRKVREAGKLLMGLLYRFACVRACQSCGCTDAEACPGGCRKDHGVGIPGNRGNRIARTCGTWVEQEAADAP